MAKKKYKPTAAFPEPNYTQTPNDYFKLLPEMEKSEAFVTAIMIRNTFGFHRERFAMSMRELEEATGLSSNAVKAGARAAEARGTFRRSNPGTQTEAEWELIVGQPVHPQPVTPQVGQPVTPPMGQPVTHLGSTSDPHPPLKRKKEKNEIKPATTTAAQPSKNAHTLYLENIGPLTPMISDAIKDAEDTYTPEWVALAIKEAVDHQARSMAYINKVLAGYKDRGGPQFQRPAVQKSYTAKPKQQQEDTRTVLERMAQNAAANR